MQQRQENFLKVPRNTQQSGPMRMGPRNSGSNGAISTPRWPRRAEGGPGGEPPWPERSAPGLWRTFIVRELRRHTVRAHCSYAAK